jgi:hypothetical protein
MAPQDPFSNQGPWRQLEREVEEFLKVGTVGYVMSGICAADDISNGPTKDGIAVPICYWKLVCFVNEEGETHVLGFVGSNSLTRNSDTEGKKKRYTETSEPKSQTEVGRLSGQIKAIKLGWNEAGKILIGNRDGAKSAPDVEKCVKAKALPRNVREIWKKKALKSKSKAKMIEE